MLEIGIPVMYVASFATYFIELNTAFAVFHRAIDLVTVLPPFKEFPCTAGGPGCSKLYTIYNLQIGNIQTTFSHPGFFSS